MLNMVQRQDIISMYEATGSIRAVARGLGMSRKTVKAYVNEYVAARARGDEALAAYLKSEPRYKTPLREKTALTQPVRELIDSYLAANEEKRHRGDRKLCMKATDMHAALRAFGYEVSYPSVCNYIHSRRTADEPPRECFIRQVYQPGMDCEFDWGESCLTVGGRRTKVYMAVFTLAYSNHRMAYLFLRQDTQAFLESHRRYFHDMGGVPHRMVYDNMRVAVASFVGGKHPTDALIRLEACYGFTHRFCNARSGNEKGHVEKSVEVVRRKAFCRQDSFDTLADAEYHIIDTCTDMNGAPLSPATEDIVRRAQEDEKALLPLKREIGAFEQRQYHVDKYATVTVGGIRYSVPDDLVDRKLTVHVYSNHITVHHDGRQVAYHEKTAVNGWKLDLMHYLRTFSRKPGSVAGSAALAMAARELREVFDRHFADTPADFVLLLTMARDRQLTPEDVITSYDRMLGDGVTPSLDAFRLYMLGEGMPQKPAPMAASSQEIERHAMEGLAELAHIIGNHNTLGYART